MRDRWISFGQTSRSRGHLRCRHARSSATHFPCKSRSGDRVTRYPMPRASFLMCPFCLRMLLSRQPTRSLARAWLIRTWRRCAGSRRPTRSLWMLDRRRLYAQAAGGVRPSPRRAGRSRARFLPGSRSSSIPAGRRGEEQQRGLPFRHRSRPVVRDHASGCRPNQSPRPPPTRRPVGRGKAPALQAFPIRGVLG